MCTHVNVRMYPLAVKLRVCSLSFSLAGASLRAEKKKTCTGRAMKSEAMTTREEGEEEKRPTEREPTGASGEFVFSEKKSQRATRRERGQETATGRAYRERERRGQDTSRHARRVVRRRREEGQRERRNLHRTRAQRETLHTREKCSSPPHIA